MQVGVVKSFDPAKHFGFIEPESGGRDVFVHWTGIVMDGLRILEPGIAVEYRLDRDSKGRRIAVDVRPF